MESVFSQNTTVVLLFFFLGGGVSRLSCLSLPWWVLLLNVCSLLHKNSSLLLRQDWESAAQHIADYPELLLVYTLLMVAMATLKG